MLVLFMVRSARPSTLDPSLVARENEDARLAAGVSFPQLQYDARTEYCSHDGEQ